MAGQDRSLDPGFGDLILLVPGMPVRLLGSGLKE